MSAQDRPGAADLEYLRQACRVARDPQEQARAGAMLGLRLADLVDAGPEDDESMALATEALEALGRVGSDGPDRGSRLDGLLPAWVSAAAFAATTRLRWRLICLYLQRHRDHPDPVLLAQGEEQHRLLYPSHALPDHRPADGVTDAAADALRRRALRLIAQVPVADAPSPAGDLLSAMTQQDIQVVLDQGRAAQQAMADGSTPALETLLQAAVAEAVRAVSTRSWDEGAERHLALVQQHRDDPAIATDERSVVLLIAAHHLLGVARATVGLVQLQPRDQSVADIAGQAQQVEATLRDLAGHAARDRALGLPADPIVAQIEQMLHLCAGALQALLSGLETPDGPVRDRRDAAEAHLRQAPEPWRAGIEDLLIAADALAGDGDPEAASARLQDLLRRYPVLGDELADLPELLRLVDRAQRTGGLSDIDTALARVRAARASLGASHGQHAALLSMVAHLCVLRAAHTRSSQDTAAAVEAGVHAVEADREPAFETVYPLTEALLMSLVTDRRDGPYLPAVAAITTVITRSQVDGETRLAATVARAAGRALGGRGARDEAVGRAVRSDLEEAERLVHEIPLSVHSLRMGSSLVQLNLVLAAVWRLPGGSAAARRLAAHLVDGLDAHPALARELQEQQVGLPVPVGSPTAGAATSGTVGVSFREALLTMGRSAGAWEPWERAASASGPFLDRLFPNSLGDDAVADALLEAARQQVERGGPFELHPEAMVAATMDLLTGRRRQFEDDVARASRTAASPTPPPAQAAQDLDTAAARVRRLLGTDRRPLSEQGAPDPDELAAAAHALTVALAAGHSQQTTRAEAHALAGLCLAERYWAGAGDLGQLEQAVRLLDESLGAEAHATPTAARADRLDARACCLYELERGAGRLRAPDAALQAVRSALRELGRCALVADSSQQALRLAARADRIVSRAVGWCLPEGSHGDPAVTARPRDAVQIAEAGRGLVLAAATVAGRVAEQLEALGEHTAAAAWRSRTPEGLAQGFAALSATPEGAMLVRTPMSDDVSMALLAAGLDAIVYLVPPPQEPLRPRRPGPEPSVPARGHALVVGADFQVEHLELPGVALPRSGPLAQYLGAVDDAFGPAEPGAQEAPATSDEGVPFHELPRVRAWAVALDAVGRWAYEAILRPVMSHFAVPLSGPVPERPLRLGLIPLGDLGAVPYAAAWAEAGAEPGVPGPAGRRLAIHDLALSYGASARLLADAARHRRQTAASRPVILADPADDLHYGRLAADALVRSTYPGARSYGAHGKDGPADIGVILSALPHRGASGPTASLLYLLTHAEVSSPDDPFTGTVLLVAEDVELSLGAILDQARDSTDGPSCLVVCDACVTDHALAHQDESLTIATAFLAAGATGVIGTRWPVSDDTAAALGFVLHHHLAQGLPAPLALRQAQLWMSDPGRRPVPGMPTELFEEWAPGRFTELVSWAAYTHHGT